MCDVRSGASVLESRPEDLHVRSLSGTADPFYPAARDYADALADATDAEAVFEPGGHDAAYWRRMLPVELRFLGEHLRSTA
jgi:enterochelin esterase-like enzyme